MTLTKNEILASRNVPDAFRLALVRVEDGVALAPRYLSNFPFPEPAFAEVSRSFRLADLEKAAGVPH